MIKWKGKKRKFGTGINENSEGMRICNKNDPMVECPWQRIIVKLSFVINCALKSQCEKRCTDWKMYKTGDNTERIKKKDSK